MIGYWVIEVRNLAKGISLIRLLGSPVSESW